MEKTNKNKKVLLYYMTPEIELVKLDNEISLALESPPAGPGESGENLNNSFNDPFKATNC